MQDKNKSFLSFIIIWIGQFLSSIGNGLTAFVLGIFIYQRTGSASSYSLIILAAFLPSLLLKPIGGAICDKFDRRLMMIIGDLGSALSLIFIVLMMYGGNTDLWIIFCGVISSSLFTALQNPAYKASVTDLITQDSFTKASGLMQLSESAKFILSPVIAGFLMNSMDIMNVLIIDILTYIIAVLSVLQVKRTLTVMKSDSDQLHFIKDLNNGFRYLFSQKSLLGLLLITSLITFFIGFLQALLGPMILVFADSETLGMITSISATGMIISSLLIGTLTMSDQKIPILSLSLFLAGIFYSLLGISTSTILIIFSGFLFFMALPFVNTSLDVLLRRNVSNDMQGRVWSIVSFISQFGMLIAFSSAGFIADRIFNPLFTTNGLLAGSSIGQIIGVGAGRGIGFMFLISGLFISIIAILISRLRILKDLDSSLAEFKE